MAQARPYYADRALSARFYDLVTAADTRLAGDLEVYVGLAPAGGAILELGAGTGRLTFALAAQGFTVTGVEIAPAMLAQAQARRAALPADLAGRIDLRRGDMTALDLKQTFDLVVCPYFTLAHVPAGAAWRNTFAVAARHLRSGGRAAFHLPRLDLMRLPAPPPDRPVLDLPLDDGGRLNLNVREKSFREAQGRLDQVIDYITLDAQGRPAGASRERLTYYMADPAPLAATAGLVPDGAPIDIGGVGDVHVFVKP